MSSSRLEAEVPEDKVPSRGGSTLNENDGDPPSYNEEQYYMSGPKLFILIAGLCVSLFLLGLDTAIVSTVSRPC
jgi:hypothetical protein